MTRMTVNELVYPHERVDELNRDGYRLIQDPKRFCFGMDAVLLSAFAKVRKGEQVLDLCTGTGILPVLLAAKTEGAYFAGVEIQPESADMARRSILLNGLEDRVTIRQGDVRCIENDFPRTSFDVVTVNPPYMNTGGGVTNAYTPKTIARHEVLCALPDVADAAVKMLKTKGRLYLVHRPHRIVDILSILRARALEPKTLRFVQPYTGAKPSMVLVEAIRDGRPMADVLPPLIIHTSRGEGYTEEVRRIYEG